MEREETYLFDRNILKSLDLGRYKNQFNGGVTIQQPGDSLVIRPLSLGDYERGFLDLLSQLTVVGDIKKPDFIKRFMDMKLNGGYYVTVIEDTTTNRIVGTATLVTEMKFIRGCATKGRLEDVVVNESYRGKQLGKLIVITVTLLSEHLGCYKMNLECKDDRVPFYVAMGYKAEPGNANSLQIRFNSVKNKSQL